MDNEVNIALHFQTKNQEDQHTHKSKRSVSRVRHRFSKMSPEYSDSESGTEFLDFAPPPQKASEEEWSEYQSMPLKSSNIKDTNHYLMSLYQQYISEGYFKSAILGYDVINMSVEKETCLAHDLVSKLGWLEDPKQLWKYRSRRRASRVPGLNPLPRFSMVDFWAKCWLSLALVILTTTSLCVTRFQKITSVFFIILSFSLTLRALNLILWTRRINHWIQMFNQFIGVYSEMDLQTKRGINWLQEIELVSKGFRSFVRKDDLSLPEPNMGETLVKVYEVLNQALIKFDTARSCLIERFPNHLSFIFPSCLESRTPSSSEAISLIEVKLQLEQCFRSRAYYLMRVFSLMSEQHLQPTNMDHVSDSLEYTGQQLTDLSYSGNAHGIQILSFLEPKPSNHSRKSSQISFSLAGDKPGPAGDNSSPDDIKVNQILRSLNTLELEMRSWHAQLHLFNQSLGSRTVNSSKLYLDQFQNLVKDINVIASDADTTMRHLKEWNMSDSDSSPSTQLSSPEPDSLSIFEEPSSTLYLLDNDDDQDPMSLLKQKEDVFEGDVISIPVPEFKPLSPEDRKKRQEAFKQDQQERQERQAAFLGMTQELGDAIRNHASFRQTLKQPLADDTPSP